MGRNQKEKDVRWHFEFWAGEGGSVSSLFHQEMPEHWVRSSGRIGVWDMLSLWREDAVPRRGQICDRPGLEEDHVARLQAARPAIPSPPARYSFLAQGLLCLVSA